MRAAVTAGGPDHDARLEDHAFCQRPRQRHLRGPALDVVLVREACVVVQVRLRCGAPELATVLHALESGSPRVFVDNLNILAQRYFYMPGQARGANSGGLDVSFDMYGYIPPRPASAQSRAGGRRATR